MAGSLESNDCLVSLHPLAKEELREGEEVRVEVDSIVQIQFGAQIEATARDVLARFGLTRVLVRIQDKGALDCTLRARLEAAVLRAGGDDHEA
jgi:citrate lyase subunit gamma (acyl carrier protein)